MFCSQCGSKMEDASLFCPQCGTKIAHISPLEQQPQPPSALWSQNEIYEAQAPSAPKKRRWPWIAGGVVAAAAVAGFLFYPNILLATSPKAYVGMAIGRADAAVEAQLRDVETYFGGKVWEALSTGKVEQTMEFSIAGVTPDYGFDPDEFAFSVSAVTDYDARRMQETASMTAEGETVNIEAYLDEKLFGFYVPELLPDKLGVDLTTLAEDWNNSALGISAALPPDFGRQLSDAVWSGKSMVNTADLLEKLMKDVEPVTSSGSLEGRAGTYTVVEVSLSDRQVKEFLGIGALVDLMALSQGETPFKFSRCDIRFYTDAGHKLVGFSVDLSVKDSYGDVTALTLTAALAEGDYLLDGARMTLKVVDPYDDETVVTITSRGNRVIDGVFKSSTEIHVEDYWTDESVYLDITYDAAMAGQNLTLTMGVPGEETGLTVLGSIHVDEAALTGEITIDKIELTVWGGYDLDSASLTSYLSTGTIDLNCHIKLARTDKTPTPWTSYTDAFDLLTQAMSGMDFDMFGV